MTLYYIVQVKCVISPSKYLDKQSIQNTSNLRHSVNIYLSLFYTSIPPLPIIMRTIFQMARAVSIYKYLLLYLIFDGIDYLTNIYIIIETYINIYNIDDILCGEKVYYCYSYYSGIYSFYLCMIYYINIRAVLFS